MSLLCVQRCAYNVTPINPTYCAAAKEDYLWKCVSTICFCSGGGVRGDRARFELCPGICRPKSCHSYEQANDVSSCCQQFPTCSLISLALVQTPCFTRCIQWFHKVASTSRLTVSANPSISVGFVRITFPACKAQGQRLLASVQGSPRES